MSEGKFVFITTEIGPPYVLFCLKLIFEHKILTNFTGDFFKMWNFVLTQDYFDQNLLPKHQALELKMFCILSMS